MKARKRLLLAGLAAGGLAIAGPAAAQHGGGHWGDHGGGGHWSGGGGHWSGGGGHWSGGGGHWDGGHGHWGGGHWHGGGWSWGLYLGGPYWGWGYPYSWGYPYYYAYPYYYGYYPYYGYPYGGDVYYGYPQAYGPEVPQDQDLGPAPQAVPGPGAPSQGPLYMNYCESAKAYYPKVTQCPEGWKFIAPSR